MKTNINLGDDSKFVGYKTNGISNCLDLCKLILKNYGLTSFGSSANVFKLMYENNGELIHYGNDIETNYQNAIKCIDRHLEAGRPIIVGVNHTLNKDINEGATDHFVVIYGKGYDENMECNFYNYYEVGKSDIKKGYDDILNRFYFKNGNELFDPKSGRSDEARFDVTQVRPNDGNVEGTVSQNSN